MLPWWTTLVAALAGTGIGGAVVHAIYAWETSTVGARHGDRASGVSVAQTRDTIRHRDHAAQPPHWFLQSPATDDADTEPLPVLHDRFRWPVRITYTTKPERGEHDG